MASEYPSEFSTIVGDFGGGGGGQASQPRLNVFRMLRLRWPGMLIVFLIFAIPAAVVAWIFVPAQYTAVASIQFLSVQPRVLSDSNVQSFPYDKFVNTQVNRMTDFEILRRVTMEPQVRALPVIQEQKSPLEFLRDKLTAYHQPATEIVRVMCTLPQRDATKVIVDAVTKVYIELARAEEAERGGQRMRTLRETRSQIERELASSSARIAELQNQLDMPIPNLANLDRAEATKLREVIADAEKTLNDATTRMQAAERVLEQARSASTEFEKNPDAPIYNFGVEGAVSSNPAVASLRATVTQTETELDVKKRTFKDNNPQLHQLQQNIESLRGRLAGVEREARREALNSFIGLKQTDYDNASKEAENAKALLDEFRTQLKDHEGTLGDATQAYMEYQNLVREEESKRRELERIKQEISTIQIEESAPARVQAPTEAVVPQDPEYGKKLQFMLLGIIGAGGLGVSFGLWRELIDQQIRSPQDVTTMTAVPLIAAIPHLSEDRLPADVHSPLLILDHPNSPTADEFRRILVRLLYPAEGATEINSCLITSPTRGDGKTSMACNLAVALAEADRRVLLLDISSREASIERCFHLQEGPGLCDILCGSGSLMEYMRPVSVPNLHILGPGFGDGDLAGRLASRELLELLEEAEHEFEHVIIDSPPSLLMADARLLAPVVDGVVVVVGAGVSTVGMLRRCLRELDQVGATVVGIALNRLRSTRGGYFKSNYDLYYNYSVDREKDWEPPKDVPEMEVFESGDGASEEAELILLEHETDEQEDKHGAARS